MKIKFKIYQCPICKNTILKLTDNSEELSCCGQRLKVAIAKTKGDGQEKHLPIVINNNEIKVGTIPHPITPEHQIEWIATVNENICNIKWISENDKSATWKTPVDKATDVYDYCNLHGLWKKNNK